MLEQLAAELREHDVTTDIVRVVDHDVRPGVTADEGDGDEWPVLRQRLLDADILVLGTPIWLGAVRFGELCGRDDLSCNPATPSARSVSTVNVIAP